MLQAKAGDVWQTSPALLRNKISEALTGPGATGTSRA